ncbi:MAG: glycosyl transferase [Clostridium sp.]|nr:glycosyl transferase [Clostridium sp.]
MIPKILHCCWFGHSPLPSLAKKCIASWQKFLPDYEIRLWNEDTFDISSSVQYVQEAYAAHRYAFVTDYVRFWVLEKYGGLYFDTDVEVIASLDEIVSKGNFLANELSDHPGLMVAPGLGLGFEPHHVFLRSMLESYKDRRFLLPDGKSVNTTTVVSYTTDILLSAGAQNTGNLQCFNDITIYPAEVFCPKDTKGRMRLLTANTKTIHHFAASWQTPYERFVYMSSHLLGGRITSFVVSIKKLLK